ncbi:MAG: hypothetical protein K0S76_1334 [Herbinix sp.]|jgi:hypothetical protein|nr:hypothetical protein [Herbinix sp.]
MLKTAKRVLIFLIILTIIGTVAILLYTNNRTFFNEEDEVGNTSGNIYNGGLFCEQDGKIYFSNDFDDGCLYVMNSDCSNVKKIHKDKAVYINVDENYIYYLRANNTRENNSGSLLMFNNTGIYRITQAGGNLKAITTNPGSFLTLKGNFLYFQRYDVGVGLYLHQYQIDGTKERLLIKDSVIPAAVEGNYLYYAGYSDNHNINQLNLSSFNSSTLLEGNMAYPIFHGNYIYYISLEDKYKLYRMNRDGSEPTLLVDERCSTYNITNSGKYLYYQVDHQEKSRICRMNLETLEEETLIDGNYKQIHVTEQYVFFKDFDNTETYVVSSDGSSKLGTFNPGN